ncbi:lysozyme inhibitor LprI family protein [Serratia rhizosphaerae]|uniref:DUF1311 domain-containing protein n=1 Tax=Serratia rhizosphaerae TaxID=2597702 RepID=A0ABX6GU09_9GAMM|nr:lysozyme inhibitor LprI family protein [Serratia rhizosphaerae]QHA89766.1 DUF1311 domain-containing protein [Serratia rhizosphaerae]
MKRYGIIILAGMPVFSGAVSDIEGLISKDPAACRKINVNENYPALLACVTRLSARSEQRLNARLAEIRKDLAALGDVEYRVAFETAQTSWEHYRTDYCAYITMGMDRRGSAFKYQSDFCSASENYRRLDTLEGEPSAS